MVPFCCWSFSSAVNNLQNLAPRCGHGRVQTVLGRRDRRRRENVGVAICRLEIKAVDAFCGLQKLKLKKVWYGAGRHRTSKQGGMPYALEWEVEIVSVSSFTLTAFDWNQNICCVAAATPLCYNYLILIYLSAVRNSIQPDKTNAVEWPMSDFKYSKFQISNEFWSEQPILACSFECTYWKTLMC